MPEVLFGIYTTLVLIRPMDWWQPILGWQLVTVAAAVTMLATFPKFMNEWAMLWRNVPALRWGAFFVAGVTLSWLPPLWLEGMNRTFQEMGKLYVYLFLVYLLARSERGYRVFLWTVLGCTLWMGVHAVLQHHRGYGFGNQPPLWRVRHWEAKGEDEPPGVWQAIAFGTFEDPNDLCLQFIIAVPLLWAEMMTTKNAVLRVIAAAGMPLCVYGVWLTNSRGGYLGVFAMVVAYLLGRTKGFKRWALLTTSLIFLTVFAPSRFAAGLVGQQDRSILWGDGIAMFKANPFFGIGFYQFPRFQEDHKVAHNTYVHVLAEAGLVGYLPFFCLLYFSVVPLRRALNLKPWLSRTDHLQLAAIFSAAVGYLTSIYFLSRHRTHMLYILIGLMGAKTLMVCRSREMFQYVMRQGAIETRNALVFGLGSIIFMWITIRVCNALG
ncbi:MAG: O-antigen ligase family protein [Verrucomicrobiae bacterium]|nr:O-antigen ligase family protein [Verrucomicrobiae bacterium]